MMLTPKMELALVIVRRDGMIFAGYNSHEGMRTYFPASVLGALARRSLLVLSVSPDGGMMGRAQEGK